MSEQRSWVDAFFGKVFSKGGEIELGGGLNFTSGLKAIYNASTRAVDVQFDNTAHAGVPPLSEGSALELLRINEAGDAAEWASSIDKVEYISTGTFPASVGEIRMTYGDTIRVRRGDAFGYSYILKTENHLIIGSDTPVDPAQTDMQVVWQAPSTHKWWSATTQLAALNSTDFVGKSGGGTHLGSVAHPWGDVHCETVTASDSLAANSVTTSVIEGDVTSILDDGVHTLDFGIDVWRGILFFAVHRSEAPSGSVSFSARTASYWINKIAASNDSLLDVTTGVLTGTTGTDGRVTISVNEQVLYIENRMGFDITCALQVMLG